MTLFDIIALSLLAVSGIAGFVRGGAREMVTVLALIGAAIASVYALRFSGPLARQAIDPDWAATVSAVLVVFVVVYIVLRLVGGGLAEKIQATEVLGFLDRTAGLGFGLLRALVVLGAFNLAFNAATPPERVPRWISGAALYPLTTAAAQVLKAFAPKGLDMADKLKPAIADAMNGGDGTSTQQGYDSRERSGIDDLVEKSR
ncbi:MAG: CvpA family protein [Phenylobacterium sp.]|uniref:CvpA family protein n=1 Tax=Phenylobacterium sp. TaxID=1871053 RepID=UPI00391BE2B7